MPPDPKQDPPGQPEPAPGSTIDSRMSAVETEQKRQGGLLDQILAKLSGGGQPKQGDPAPDGRPIGELVREGVEQLRAEEAAQAERDAERQQRADHDTRLKALEERRPSETVATPAGRVRAAAQRWGFGIDDPRK